MGSLKKIHVNQTNIKKNIKGAKLPCITVKHKGGNDYGHEVKVLGPSRIINPTKALACGARVWIETESDVIITDFRDGSELKISG